MKIRIGFVSNSSSASFMIRVDRLNEGQLEVLHSIDDTSKKIKTVTHRTYDDYKENPKYKKILSEIEWSDGWEIYENNKILYGNTFMDNGNMGELMKKIDIDPSDIMWDDEESMYDTDKMAEEKQKQIEKQFGDLLNRTKD